MIVAEQKPLEEIRRTIVPYERVLIIGCGTCMTVCGAGGEREVSFLHNALRVAQAKSGNGTHTFSEYTLKRQCDPEFLDLLVDKVGDRRCHSFARLWHWGAGYSRTFAGSVRVAWC